MIVGHHGGLLWGAPPADFLEWGQGQAREASTVWESGLQQAAAMQLASAREQVAAAGTRASSAVNDATAAVPTATLAASLRPMMQPVGESFSQWDNVVGVHPEPGTITADGARTHILWGDYDLATDQVNGGHSFDSGIPGKTVPGRVV
ncbi:MAG TPA: hypothetical protein VG756_26160 [Pseudonocardiaceae bacterium]|jgi:hypothetical protein|nr:hypothetical protein [Pseudonocardiaceae bacterium]